MLNQIKKIQKNSKAGRPKGIFSEMDDNKLKMGESMMKCSGQFLFERPLLDKTEVGTAVSTIGEVQEKVKGYKKVLKACKRCRSFVMSPWGVDGHKEPLETYTAVKEYLEELKRESVTAHIIGYPMFSLFYTQKEPCNVSLVDSWVCFEGGGFNSIHELFLESLDRVKVKSNADVQKHLWNLVNLFYKAKSRIKPKTYS